MKKRLLTAGLTASLALASVAYSHAIQEKSGFYLGAGIGIGQDLVDYGPLSGSSSQSVILSVTNHVDTYKNHLFADVFTGYRANFKHLFIDSELSVNIAEHKKNVLIGSSLNPTEYMNVDSTTDLNAVEPAFDFHFGKVLYKQTAFYALVGASLNRKRLTSIVSAEDTEGVDIISGVVTASSSSSSLAFRFGLGVEQSLSSYAGLRLSYVYTLYHKVSVSGSEVFGTSAPALLTITNSATAKINNQSVMLAALFRFT